MAEIFFREREERDQWIPAMRRAEELRMEQKLKLPQHSGDAIGNMMEQLSQATLATAFPRSGIGDRQEATN